MFPIKNIQFKEYVIHINMHSNIEKIKNIKVKGDIETFNKSFMLTDIKFSKGFVAIFLIYF